MIEREERVDSVRPMIGLQALAISSDVSSATTTFVEHDPVERVGESRAVFVVGSRTSKMTR